MFDAIARHLELQLREIREQGLEKQERILISPQGPRIRVRDSAPMLNFCANNYLGLANHPEIVAAATKALHERGYGMASVRFICGTQDLHRELENALTDFLGTQDTILYSSCFDANGGLFETILEAPDAVISDELNHASIIDGIRLCKAHRYRFRHNDMADLEKQLCQAVADGSRFRLIATDGVFSMDGHLADLPAICDLADRYGAVVMVDDSHAVGFMGANGRGTHEHFGVMGRVDIITGTLGKAVGGAGGGYTSGPKPLIDLLRQRSRPYLFSNSTIPCVVEASLAALRMMKDAEPLRRQLRANAERFRAKMTTAGFTLMPGQHPIVPVMFGDARQAVRMAARLWEQGVYVVAFSYPVVPMGKARIRVQLSAAHDAADIDRAVGAFVAARDLGTGQK
jgi:glycine C-acetyltransferase